MYLKRFLTGYNGQTITYDAIGNPLTYRDGLSFNWNGRQMSSAKNGSSTSNYTYNNDGIRTSKTVAGVTTKYFVDGSTILAQQTGNDVLWFMYDSDGTRVGFTYNGTAYYYTTNAQGDVTGIVDKDCNTVVQYSYDSWGKLLSTTGSLASTIGSINPFRYRGYYYDNETGLYYLNSRYYDANTGRFVNADGQLNSGSNLSGMNMFSYCGNQPVNRIDTDGHSWWDVALVCAAVAVVCAVAVVAAPVLAVAGAGIAVSTAAVAAIAYVGYVAATVSIIACAITATQTVAYSIPRSTPKVQTQSKEKSIAKAPPRNKTQSKYCNAKATHPGAKVYVGSSLTLSEASNLLRIGNDIYAKDAASAEELCIAAGGGFTGPTNDNNPLNAMHYHTLVYISRGHVFYGDDPNLQFVTIFD